MKRKVCLGLSFVLCLGLLTGCGNKLDVDESTVYVDKDGSVISVDMEDFEEDYYDETELETYVNEEIETYTSENGKKSVSLKDFTVEDGVATLTLRYKTAEDYTGFNGIELYMGTVVKAMAAGYDFNVSFVAVEDGIVSDFATKEEVLEHDDYKVAIIKANTNVKIDGTIVYVSNENANITGKNTISIREGYEAVPTESVSSEASTESIVAEDTEEMTSLTENTSETEDDEFAYETDVYTYVIFK